MKFSLFIITILLVFSVKAQVQLAANCKADLLNFRTSIDINKGEINEEMKRKFPIHTIAGIHYMAFLAKSTSDFNQAALADMGMIVGAKINSIISLNVPLSSLDLVETIPGISYLQLAGKIRPELNKVVYDTRVDSVHQGIGLPQAFTGKDVLIGITDWGFDYTHPMYYDTTLTETRILAAWDQFKNSGPSPAGYGYGTEYISPAELLAAKSDTANIYSYALHGGHVAGIAGGCGAGTPFRGMAFESEFLFTTFLVDEAAVLDAWDWMYQKAQIEDKRLVINMSWGLYYLGAMDGTSLLSQALNDFSDLGVVFVTSAGNNGDVDFHIKKDFSGDMLRTRIQFYTGALASLWGQSIQAWGDVDGSFSAGIQILNGSNTLLIESPYYSTLDTDTYIDTFLVVPATTDTIFYNLSMDAAYPTNNRPQMRLRVKKNETAYKITLKATAAEGTVHFWNVTETTTDVGNWGMEFQSFGAGTTAGDPFYGIGIPACTESAISVAAHTASYLTMSGTEFGGNPANFSSYGPLIDESMKPDISAPGVAVASSISSYTDNSFAEAVSITFEGRDYPFARLSGTSMSSPVVAGISALILEANPYLSPWQVKIIIQQTAREDDFTGEIPIEGSTKWGMGKIDAYHCVIKALNTTGQEEIDKPLTWSIYPNPASSYISIGGINGSVQSIQLFNLAGELVGIAEDPTQISIQHLPSGTYILRLIIDDHVEQSKFIVQ
jgi:minor extracellular serine protease Vpr